MVKKNAAVSGVAGLTVKEAINNLKSFKKSIISKAIKVYTNCNIYPIIPEDKFNIVRLGNLNIKKYPLFTYKNTTSVIRKVPITSKIGMYDDTRKISLIVKYEDISINDNNIYWIENGVIMKKRINSTKKSIEKSKIKTYQMIS